MIQLLRFDSLIDNSQSKHQFRSQHLPQETPQKEQLRSKMLCEKRFTECDLCHEPVEFTCARVLWCQDCGVREGYACDCDSCKHDHLD